MISLTNFLNKAIGVSLVFFCISGCGGSKNYTSAGSTALGKPINPYTAVLPIDNLTGRSAPVDALRESIIMRLKAMGVPLLDDERLKQFMEAHRIRNTGGIDMLTAQAFRNELGVEAVLITNLGLYDQDIPPKISIFSRLVATDVPPYIIWIDGVSRAGDDSRGLFEIGLIEDHAELRERALDRLFHSIQGYLATNGEGKTYDSVGRFLGIRKKFEPRAIFSLPVLQKGKQYSIAVVPFTNKTARRNAGEMILLHFVNQLAKDGSFSVMEPGVVRERLINMRIISPDGLSLFDAGILFSSLDVDLVMIGKGFDYQDYTGSYGTPKAEFSVFLLERKSRRVIWSSSSYDMGDEYIYAFDWGKIYTAQLLVSGMSKNIVQSMTGAIFEDSPQAP